MIKKLCNYIIVKNGEINFKKYKKVQKKSFRKNQEYYKMIIKSKRNKYKLKFIFIKLKYNKLHKKFNKLD